jgi:hypothetical protein
MTKKRKHHRINIQELSAVDRPAQKGAVMNIMKRDRFNKHIDAAIWVTFP